MSLSYPGRRPPVKSAPDAIEGGDGPEWFPNGLEPAPRVATTLIFHAEQSLRQFPGPHFPAQPPTR